MENKLFTLIICLTLASCGGLRTFHEYARAGDTVAIPVGMKPDFNKDNITVTITPSSGDDIVLGAADPAIRAIINFYPDPISNMIVSREIDEDLTPSARTYALTALASANLDKDYYQTTVFLDLPTSLPVGLTQVAVSDGSTTHAATLDIITGTGSPNVFQSDWNSGVFLTDDMLDSLARASHTEVTFDASSIPNAIELNFTHGTGKVFVVNPLGYRKTLVWNDDGTNMKVILMQSKDGIIDDLNDYKFYITGTAGSFSVISAAMYDVNGNEVDYDSDGIPDILTVNLN